MGLLDTIGSVFRIKESYIVGPDFQRLIESGYHSAYEDSPHEYKPYKSFVMSISNALKSSKSLPERAEV